MEIVKFDLLSSKFNSSISNNKGYIPLLRRHKKIGLFFNLVLCLLFILLGNNAYARLPFINSTKFDCNSLYSVSNGTGNAAGTTGTIFKVDLFSGQKTTMYALDHQGSTIALGHKGGRSSGGPLVMYSWTFGGQASRKLWTVEYGATESGETSTMFDFRGPAPFGSAATNWAGGEVNQITGEVYMTNVAGSGLNPGNTGNFRLGIFNPVTGANRVGIPKALTKGDAVAGAVGSDMAIDAEGNAYLIVQDSQHGPVHKVLIKVMPTANSEYWPYVLVQHLRGLPTQDVWGMAFVDGQLYTSHSNYQIWRSSPLTGASERLPSYSGNVVDLSSCQVAPVIKGKVYLDPIGEGNFNDFKETVPNVQVELWKDGALIATHHTSEVGEFNFIVDSIENQDYYVRIVRPEINGMRAKQSWAAASIATNSVTAYCGGSDKTRPTPITESGPCVGASPYELGSITSVDKSYIYSLVNMKTDDLVADASVAITAVSNYGDAPSSYNHATKPAQHVATGAGTTLNEFVNLLRLGEKVTIQNGPQPREDANTIASHDGVEVSEKKRENFISLQDAILTPGKAYTFRVKATGRDSQKAYLNAWADWSDKQKQGKFGDTRLGLADMPTQRNNYVKFDYQVPSGSATGLHHTYARFRVSTTKGLGPNNDTLPDPTETTPWAVDGEVEDYRFYIATGEIKLSAVSVGKLGKFNYDFSNVVNEYPSSGYDSIQTMSENSPAYSSVAHAYASVGKPVIITQSFDDNTSNWTAVSAECYDENDKLISGTIFEKGKLTIPGELVKEGGLSCQFKNSYSLNVELIKKISGERVNNADQFTIQIKDDAKVVASATTTGSDLTATTDPITLKPGTYTLTEVMAAGSKSTLARYKTDIDCKNENTQSITKLPLGNGNSFTLTPDYGDKITCTLTNTAISPDLTKSIIFANPLEIIANDGEEDGIATITVQLRDSSGQNITEGGDKIEIYFSDAVNHVGSIIDGTNAVDNGDGTYSIKVKSNVGGSDSFSYKVNGQEGSNTVTLKYKPGKPDLTQSTITAAPAAIFADNTEQSVITVQLKDRLGNDLTFGGNYVITLVGKEQTIGQVSPSNYIMQNNGDGTFTAYVKSTIAGEDTFGFKIDSELATQETKVTYKAGIADPNTSEISVNRKEITADGSEVSIVTVTLKDSFGNLLPSSNDPKTNSAYNVIILPKNKPPITDIEVVTNNNGDGTFTAKITSTKAGADTFGFTIDGVQGKPETQITYLPGLPDLKQSTITANPSSITADGNDKSDIIIQLKDKFGNNITAQSGKVLLTDVKIATQSSAIMEAEYVSGKYKYSLSSTKTGIDDQISFTLDGNKSENTTSLEYLPGSADLTQSTISVSPDTIVADDTEIATITVQLRDAKGNKLTKSAGFVDLIFNDGNGRIGKVDRFTKIKDNEDGTYTATVKSTKAGSDKIGFMLNSVTSTNTTNLVYKPGEVDLTVSTITANPTTIEANNTETSIITVQLKDKYGNNLETNEGQIHVELNTDNMIGKVSNNGVFKYQGSGRYEIEVTSIKAGSDTFNYSLDGKGTGQQSVTVNYKTGGVSLTTSTITTKKNKIIADDSDETTIVVQLKDQFENNIKAPMGEQERVFLVNLNKGYPSLGVGQFELAYIGNGRYEANIKSKIAGTDNIGYKVGQSENDALVGINKVEVTYEPGAVDFEKSTIVANPSSIIANGQTSSTVTVQLKDKFNNLITEDQGKISLIGLTLGELKNNTGYLDYQNGSYIGYVTSTKKGNDADIRFTLNNQGTSQGKVSITYTPDRVNLAKSTIVASKPEIIADYRDVSVITIQFKDSYGNNLDGEVDGVVSLVDLNNGEIKTTLKSIGDGAYQAEIYSKVAGADNIGFALDGNRGGQGSTGIARVVYQPGEADLATSTIEADPDVIIANNVTTAKIHVQLKDKFGNKLITAPNDDIKIFISNTDNVIGSLTDFTNYNNGTYSALVKSSKTGKDLIDFSINGVASGKPASVTYIAGSADAAQSLISATPAIIVADDNSISTVTVQLRDANGNNLTNSIGNAVSISVVSNSPVNGTTISQVKDNNDGTYSVTVKSKRTGVDLFGFYVLGAKSGNTTDITYIPGNADLAQSTITATPSTIVADGVEQTKITVQLKDKFNNKLDSDVGSVKLTNVLIAEAGNITLKYDGEKSGSYSGYLTSKKDGSDTISFELNGSAAINQSTTVVYKSGGVSLSRSTITADPDTIIADDIQTSEIIIQLKDQYGNDTYNNENVVLVGIEKGKLVTFGPIPDQKGKFKAIIKSTKAGLDTIGFKVDNVESANKVAVTYRPGEPSLNRSSITVTPSEIIADNGMTKATVTVYLKDNFDNDLDAPINETVSLDSNSLVIGLSDSLTMTYAGDNIYKTTVYSKQAGTDTLKYKIGSNIGTNSALITYVPGPVSLTSSEITATPDEVIANGVDQSTIVVQLKDQYGNNLTTNPGLVSLFGLGDSVSIDVPMTYRGNGRYEGKIVSSKTGKHLIGYTISNIGDGINKTNVTFKPGPVSMTESVIISAPNTIVANGQTTSTISIQLKDAKGNNLDTDQGKISLIGLNYGNIAQDMTYVGDGRYEGKITSTRANKDTIGFQLGNQQSSNTTTVTYTAGEVDLTKSVMTAEPKDILANNSEESLITVQLKDGYGNDIGIKAGEVMLEGLVNGKIKGNAGSTKLQYQGDGKYTGSIISSISGTDNIGFNLDGETANGPDTKVTINYNPGPVDITVSTIKASPVKILADGSAQSTITIELKDKDGNHQAKDVGVVELLGIVTGTEPRDVNKVTYIGNGVYQTTVTSTNVGSDNISYRLTETSTNKVHNSPQKVTIEYVAGAVDLSKSTIEIDKTSIKADGVEQAIVTVSLRDKYDHLIASSSNQVTLILKGDRVGEFTPMANTGNGIYQFTVNSTVTGTDDFEYRYFEGNGWLNGVGNVSVTYKPGAIDITKSSIDVNPQAILSDNLDKATITVTLRDSHNNLVTTPNTQVKLDVSGDKIGETPVAITPNNDGVFKFTVTSTKSGKDIFSYQFNENNSWLSGQGNVAIEYLQSDIFDKNKSTITVDPKEILADGLEESIITVQLYYASNPDQPLAGLKDGVELVHKDGAPFIGKVENLGESKTEKGVYKFKVTSTEVGTDQFKFKTNSTTSDNSGYVKYLQGDAFDKDKSTITVEPKEILADGLEESIITVQLYYASNPNQPLVGLKDGVELVHKDGKSFVGKVENLGESETEKGVYRFKVTSTTVGSDQFKFKTKSTTSDDSGHVKYLQGDKFDENASSIEAQPQQILADGQAVSTVTVKLYYASNPSQPLAGLGNNVELATQSGTMLGQVVKGGETAPGVYSFTVTSTVLGTDDFIIKTASMASVKSAAVSYVLSDKFDENASSIEAQPQQILADGQAASTVTVKLYYASNPSQPLAGLGNNVELATQSGTMLGQVVKGGETAPGVYSFTVTSTALGTDDFIIKTASMASVKSAAVSYVLSDKFDENASSIEAQPQQILADGQAASTVTVKLYYASNPSQPLAGLGNNVELATQSGTMLGQVVKGGETAPGVYSFTVTSTALGTDDFIIKTASMTSVKSAAVSYVLSDKFDENASSIEAQPQQILADGQAASTVTVKLYYASNPSQPLAGLGNNVELATQSGTMLGQVVKGGETAPGVYSFTVTSTALGTDDFIIKTASMASVKSAAVSYVLSDKFDENASSIEAQPQQILADGQAASTVTVKLYYASNPSQPLAGLGNNVELATQSGTMLGQVVKGGETAPGVYSFTVTSTALGTDDFIIKTASMASVKSAAVSYVLSDKFDENASSIEAQPQQILADGQAVSTVTVKLYYASNPSQPLAGLGNNVELATQSGTVLGQVVKGGETAPGVYSFTVTSTALGTDDFIIKTASMASVKSAAVSYVLSDKFDESASSIEAQPQQILADGQAASTVTVKLYYASNPSQPLAGLGNNVELATQSGTVLGQVVKGGETAPGVYSFTVTSTALGTDDFIIKTASMESVKSAAVSYVLSDKFDENASSIEAQPQQILADGQAASTVTVKLYYASNPSQPLAGLGNNVELATQSGTMLGQVVKGGETAPGVYSFTVTSTALGTDDFIIKTASMASVKSAAVSYVLSDKFDENASSIEAQPQQILADGQAASTVTVKLYYASNPSQPLAGLGNNVELATQSGTMLGQVVKGGETAPGVYSFTVTSTALGTDDFIIKTASMASVKSAAVSYVLSDKFDENASSIEAQPQQILADGQAASTVTVKLYYASNPSQPLAGLGNNVELATQSGTMLGQVVKGGETAPGVYSFTVTSTALGTDDFIIKTASMASVKSAAVSYVLSDKFDENASSIEAQPQQILADGQAASTVTVKLYYASNPSQPLAGLGNNVELATQSGTVLGQVVKGGETAPGVYSFTVTSTALGTDDFIIKTASMESVKSAAVSYVLSDKFDENASSIEAQPQQILADGQAASTVTVKLYYASNPSQPLAGLGNNVELATQSGTMLGQVVKGGETAPGVYSFTVTSTALGTDDFIIKTASMASVKSAAVSYVLSDKFDENASSIEAQPQQILADGQAASTVTVKLYYASNPSQPLAGLGNNVELATQSGTMLGQVVKGGETAPGVYSFTVTSTALGTDDFIIKTASMASVKSAAVSYVLSDKFDENASSIEAQPQQILADGQAASTVTVKLYYASNPSQPLAGLGNNVELATQSGTVLGQVVKGGETAPGVYSFTVTSTALGTDDFIIKTASMESVKSAAVSYVLSDKFDENASSIEAQPQQILADGQAVSTVTVKLYYASNPSQPLAGLGNNVELATQSGTVLGQVVKGGETAPGVYSFTVTSTALGTDDFIIKTASMASVKSAAVSYVLSDKFDENASSIEAQPQQILADGQAASTVTVKLYYASNPSQPLAGLGNNVELATQSGTMLGQVVKGGETAPGVYSFTVTSTALGTDDFIIKTASMASVKSAAVSYVLSDKFDENASSIEAQPQQILADGQAASTVTVKLYYASNPSQPLAGLGNNVELATQSGTMLGQVVKGGETAPGVYSFTVTSTALGTDDFIIKTASMASVKSAAVSYVLSDKFDENASSIEAQPQQILADGQAASTVTVKLYYASNPSQPLAGLGNNVELATQSGTMLGQVVKGGETAPGVYSFTVTSTALGTDDFIIKTASMTSVKSAAVSYVLSDKFDENASSIEAQPQQILADGQAASTVTVKLYYASNPSQPLAGLGNNVELATQSGTMLGQVVKGGETAPGVYSFTVTSTALGTDDFIIKTASMASVKSAAVSYVLSDKFDENASSIEAQPQQILADGQAASTVTVKLYYASNPSQPLAGLGNNVELATQSGTMLGQVVKGGETAPGVYSFTVTSTALGTDDFIIKTASMASVKSAAVSYVLSDKFDENASSIEAQPQQILADGQAASTVTVKLYYASNPSQPLAGLGNNVELATQSGTVLGQVVKGGETAPGVYSFTVTSTALGTDDFIIKTASMASVKSAAVSYVLSDKFDESASSIEAQPQQILADGQAASTVTVKLYYASNPSQPLAGLGNNVELATQSGTVLGQVVKGGETAPGVYSFTVTSTALGTDDFIIKTASMESVKSAAVSYVLSDKFDENASSIEAQPQQILADGQAASTVTVKLYYASNPSQPLAGLGNNVELATQSGTVLGQVVKGGETAPGVYSFTVTSTALGTDDFIIKTASMESVKSAAVSYVLSDKFDENASSIEAQPQQILADGQAISTVTVKLYYASNPSQPLAGLGNNVELATQSGTMLGQVVKGGETAPGVYSFTVTSTALGTDDFIIKTASMASVKSAAVSYVLSDKFDENASSIEAQPQQILADGQAASTVTVKLYYASNPSQPLAGLGNNVELATQSGTMLGQVVKGGETAPGVYSFTVTSTALGTDDFIIKTASMESVKSAAVSYVLSDKFDENASSIEAQPQQILADGQAVSTVTVKLYYASNPSQPLAGLGNNVELATQSGTVLGQVVKGGETAPGVYSFTVTSTALGTDDFIIKTASMESVKSAAVSYVLSDKFDENASSIEAQPQQILADGQAVSTVTVKLYYASNPSQPLAGLGNNVELATQSGTMLGQVVKGGETAPGVYSFTVTSTALGTDDFIIKTASMESVKSAAVSYVLSDKFDENASSIEAQPQQILADGQAASTVTVKLYYASNPSQPLAGLGNNVELATQSGTMLGQVVKGGETAPGVYSFTVTSTALGTDDFIIKTASMESVKSAAVSYVLSDKFDENASSIEAQPQQILADGQAASTVTVKLYYASNPSQPLAGLGNNVELATQSGTMLGQVVKGGETAPGVYSFTVTSTALGTDDFIIKTASMESVKSAAVSYVLSDKFDENASSIEAQPQQILADGQAASTVTVKLYYASNPSQPLAGLGNNVELATQSGTVLGQVVKGGETAPGVYSFTVTSTALGTDDFIIKTASMASVKSAAVSYVLSDKFDENASSIEAQPQQILADGQAVSTVTVKLYYASNPSQPLAGLGNNVELATQSGTMLGQVVKGGETAPGVYSFTVTSTALGTDDFIIKTASMESVKSAAVSYVLSDKFDENASSIEAQPQQILADGQAASTVTVKLYYASNPSQPLAGLGNNVELATQSGTVLGQVVKGGETAPGVYSFTVTSTALGADDFIIKTTTTESVKSATVNYIVGDEFDQTTSTIEALPNSIRANGEDVAIVNVRLFYASNPSKPITGHTDVTLISKDPNKAIVGNVTPMGEIATGVYSFKVTSEVIDSDEFAFKTTNTVSSNSVVVKYVTPGDANLRITLKTSEKQVKVGDVIMFIADIENIGDADAENVSIINTLPVGFSYIADSAAITTDDAISTTGNSPIDISNISIKSKSTATLRYLVRTGAGVKPGNNIAYAEGFVISNGVSTLAAKALPVSSKRLISNRASVTVIVDNSDPMFDESLLLGTVYHDRNGNGMQDAGEPGIPGVKVISAEGLIMTTDQYGRYHLENVAGGKATRGRNYILKVDTATLPSGTTFVTRNPLVRRITPGLPVRFDFAVKLPEEQVLEVSDKLFITGKADIQSSYNKVLSKMVDVIKSNDIKEVVIVTTAKQELATMRENILRDLLNAELDEGNSVIVGSQTPAVEDK